MIQVIEVNNEAQIKEFALLPYKLYKGNEFWVPPLLKGEINSITPGKNKMAEGCSRKFWIAQKDGETVGRIGAIVHHRYNEKTGQKVGRFTRPEFIDDAEVVDKLFEAAEKWLSEQGMEAFSGPLGFSNIDTQGLLVEGFDQLASIASVYHLPYYKDHIERLGYEKLEDWVEFNLFIDEVPEKAERMFEMIQKRYGLRVESLKKSEQIEEYAHEIFHLLNKSFDDLFSFVEFNDCMIDEIVESYKPVINPKLVHLVFNSDNKIVGFIIPVPSLSRSMQKANGKLSLKSMLSIKYSRTHNDIVDLFLTGVDPEYQSKGVAGLLIAATQKVMLKYGMTTVDTTGMLETNQKAIQHWKNYRHVQNKRKRCYIKKNNKSFDIIK